VIGDGQRERLGVAGDSPSGDVVIPEPPEGWSRAVYEMAVRRYLVVRGSYPRTARMHPNTLLAVAPAGGLLPVWWPIHEVRRHHAPERIILSDDVPQLSEIAGR
jgi:hypothetical protein